MAFTPILPLMQAQAELTRTGASVLATGNYFGYLLGAILGIAIPAIGCSRDKTVTTRLPQGVTGSCEAAYRRQAESFACP